MKKKVIIIIILILILILLAGIIYKINTNKTEKSELAKSNIEETNHQQSSNNQINANNISTEGYSDFEIIVKESKNNENKKILNNKDLHSDGQDYNLYYYGLEEVNVKVNNETLLLEDALKSGKITLNGIISKANDDLDSNKISGDMYKDGGSMIYKYGTYTIIKCHTLDGNRDVYIGNPILTMNNLTF